MSQLPNGPVTLSAMLSALCSILFASLFYALCPNHYALYPMPYALCAMLYANLRGNPMNSAYSINPSRFKLLAISLISLAVISCGGNMDEKKAVLHSIKDVPETSWKKLAEKSIYFGHQSVGYNIVEGISDILKENHKIKLNIVETNNAVDFSVPLFAHSRVGKNEEPKSKCDCFSDVIEKGLGNKTDFAFFKFCFVDITAGTNVEKVFNDYKSTMSRLKIKYPQVVFIHFTSPLMTVQTGVKAFIKSIIGRSIDGYDENIKRNKFNEMLRKEYEGKQPIFDLAQVESTFPDGTRATFQKDGQAYLRLVSDYTDDGGHLNEKARKRVAEQLLILLANISK
jgi:hypothetical protein